MEISLNQLSKRYNKEWIFKDLNYHFRAGNTYAITGSNGSGKSTLLQIISAYYLPSAGSITYTVKKEGISADAIYQHIAIATPYMELIEDFTLKEHLEFHFRFRSLRSGYSLKQIMENCGLEKSAHKQIKNFSSGMKQRVKLALSFYTDCKLVLLDEPTSNLDQQGVDWYQERVKELIATRTTLIIASNQSFEYEAYANGLINIQDYKPVVTSRSK